MAIVEINLWETKFGFRKNCGTRNTIQLLRIIGERMIEKKIFVYLSFISYSKAFNRVQHNKLINMLENIGIPFHERRLLMNIYWNQMAEIKLKMNY